MVRIEPEKLPPWLSLDGPEGAVVICSQASLIRNLSDLPFPEKCRPEELRAVEEQVLVALERAGLVASGRFYYAAELDDRNLLLLVERRLLPVRVLFSSGRVAAFVSEDQSLSVAVNGADHVCITVCGSGLRNQELWTRLDEVDNQLAEHLDYAFDPRFGYLTSATSLVGTGFKTSALLHLPVLAMGNRLNELAARARERHLGLYGVKPAIVVSPKGAWGQEAPTGEAFCYDIIEALYGEVSQAMGDLFVVTNRATLGRPEEELAYHVRRCASDLIVEEKTERGPLTSNGHHKRLEDRVARALGLAGSARLLGFPEAVGLLSSIRLGLETGFVEGYTFRELNEMLIASQSGHIKARLDKECDEQTLSAERAALFRSTFGKNG